MCDVKLGCHSSHHTYYGLTIKDIQKAIIHTKQKSSEKSLYMSKYIFNKSANYLAPHSQTWFCIMLLQTYFKFYLKINEFIYLWYNLFHCNVNKNFSSRSILPFHRIWTFHNGDVTINFMQTTWLHVAKLTICCIPNLLYEQHGIFQRKKIDCIFPTNH
jgi:hypothetical protein